MELHDAIVQYGCAYKTIFRDGIVIWRPLNRLEHCNVKELAENNVLSTLEQEDYVWDKCVIDSTYNEDTLRAGIVYTVAYQIFYFTGFETTEEVILGTLSKARETVSNDFFSYITLLICRAFPSYNPDTLSTKTLNQLCELAALAELAIPSSTPRNKQQQKIDHQRLKKGNGSADTIMYDEAVRMLNGSLTGMNLSPEAVADSTHITYADMHPDKTYVETEKENQRMIDSAIPFTREYYRELAQKKWQK